MIYLKKGIVKILSLRQSMWAVLGLLVVLLIASSHYFSSTFGQFKRKIWEFTPEFNDTSPFLTSEEAVRHWDESEIQIEEILPNCGVPEQCPEDTFPVHVYTGQDKDDQSRLCVMGKYVQGNNGSCCGRGINVAIVEPVRARVVVMRQFDTYEEDSTELETFLEKKPLPRDIVIIFTFDEASKGLGGAAKRVLYALGSAKVQNVHFRSQWYMISQKGIEGFTPFETLNFAQNNRWAEVIDERLCVPKHITGQMVSADPSPRSNKERRKFCNSHQDVFYEEFCNSDVRDEQLVPALLTNRSLVGNPTFSSAIVVLADKSPLLTLETLIRQPGISPAFITVLHPAHVEDIPSLVRLFGFCSATLSHSHMTQEEKIEQAFVLVKTQFPKKKYLVIIEEDVLLAPDFLFYLAQISVLLERDRNLMGISAWNPNGMNNFSRNVHRAYRIEGYPSKAFLVPMWFINQRISTTSNVPSSSWWSSVKEKHKHVIVPEVSRVLAPGRNMGVNLNAAAWIEHPADLIEDRYFQKLVELMQRSVPLYVIWEEVSHCQRGASQAVNSLRDLYEENDEVFAIYIKEDPGFPFKKIKSLASCLGLDQNWSGKPCGLYQNLIRFSIGNNEVLLVESASPFYRSHPADMIPL